MALSANEQVRYWGIGLLVLLLSMWLLGNVLLPFITGMAIAYFLDPVADRLEAMGTSRTVATTVITMAALVVILLIRTQRHSISCQLTKKSKAHSYFKTPTITIRANATCRTKLAQGTSR